MVDFGWSEVIAMAAAVGFGALVGLEREIHGKAAGFRTNILVCLGATVFTLLTCEQLVSGISDPSSRIISAIITGVGFLGAGALIQDRGGIHGLTTAATIWIMAGVGIACGKGLYVLASISTLFTLFVLWVLNPFSHWLRKRIDEKKKWAQEFKEKKE